MTHRSAAKTLRAPGPSSPSMAGAAGLYGPACARQRKTCRTKRKNTSYIHNCAATVAGVPTECAPRYLL